MHYRPFAEIWGKPVDSSHRPSLKVTALKNGKSTGCNKNSAWGLLYCRECDKPRVVYSKKALSAKQKEVLKGVQDGDLVFLCGASLFNKDHPVHGESHSNPLLMIPINCAEPVERSYFSATKGKYANPRFPACCYNCGGSAAMTQAQDEEKGHVPCSECVSKGVVIRQPLRSSKSRARSKQAASAATASSQAVPPSLSPPALAPVPLIAPPHPEPPIPQPPVTAPATAHSATSRTSQARVRRFCR